MSVLLVTHCYAAKHSQYANLLKLQLSSLVLDPPRIPVTAAVCYSPEDTATVKVLDLFSSVTNLQKFPLPNRLLFRRCVGRNLVARASTEDIVWFTDVDYCFTSQCLNSIGRIVSQRTFKDLLLYPKFINISKTHELGEVQIHRASQQDLVQLDPDEFEPKKYMSPVGGVQIVRGSTAREWGYLDQTKWQYFTDSNEPFPDFRDDGAYRRFLEEKGRVQSIFVEGVYRIRHGVKTHNG